jgi:hypothetical protein
MHLHRIRPVLDRDGPFITLHVDVGRGTEDAAQQREARWTTIRHELARLECPENLMEDVRGRLDEVTHLPGEARRTLVSDGEDVVFDDLQAGHTHSPESVDHGPLPDLAGWLSLADQALPFVLVVADRTGADIEVHEAAMEPPTAQETVTGNTFYITKVAEGDWAQKQFQQSAENTWHHNATLVSDTVRSLIRKHRPRAVLVAGDVRARSDIIEMLRAHEAGTDGVSVISVESGGRAAGASPEALWAEMRRNLAALQAERDAEVASRLDEARGRGEGAVHGLDDVMGALEEARVDRLVLDLASVQEGTVDFTGYPGLRVPPSARERAVPADRALVAGAALTDAQLSLLPANMGRGGGVSALVRWTQ